MSPTPRPTSGLEYYIAKGGTNQGPYEACVIDPDFIVLEQSRQPRLLQEELPSYCDDFMYGRTWSFAPFFFTSVGFGSDPQPIPLSDFNIGVRYYNKETITPYVPNPQIPGDEGPDTVARVYGDFIIESQTFEMIGASSPEPIRDLFDIQPNSDNLYVVPPGRYPGTRTENGVITAPPYQNAGIINGSKYIYASCFNDADINYIPRLTPGQQGAIDQSYKTSPFNESEGIFPINTLTAYKPDERESITVTYRLTTNWHPVGEPAQTAVIEITQVVTQVVETDYSDKIEEALRLSYYTNGEFNIDLWPVDEPPLYESDGDPIDPSPRVDTNITDPSINNVYDQETNGEGFNEPKS